MAKPIGGDWVECFDERRNKIYYANILTKESTWSFPRELMSNKEIIDAKENWVEAFDTITNMKYYYNKISRETSWIQPKCLQPRKSNNNFLEASRNPTGKPFGGLVRQSSAIQDSDEEDDSKSVRSNSPKLGVALLGLDGTDRTRSLSPAPKPPPKPEERPQQEPAWGRSLSPVRDRSLSPVPKKKLAEVSIPSPQKPPIPPTPSKMKTNAFAALRALEQEKELVVETFEEMSVGYDDGTITRQSEISPPSSTPRHTSDPFPSKPSTAPPSTLYDGLKYANITTEELIAKATLPLENYAEARYNFDRKGLFGTRTSLEKLLSWKNDLISSPLHDFDPSLKDDSIQIFKNITGYMGDRQSKKAAGDHYHKILTIVLCSPQELVDELFCQLCKQLTKNPSVSSQKKGWELLLLCLSSVAPSDDLLPSALHFCKLHLKNDSDSSLLRYAEIAMHKFYKATLLGVRHTLPTALEISSIQQLRPLLVRIWFVDGSYISVPCDSWMSVGELEDRVAAILEIHTPSAFGLFEVALSEEERCLLEDERVLDLLSVWRNIENEDISSGKRSVNCTDEEFSFVYKVKYFFDINDSDRSGVELMYLQAVYDVVNSTYMCKIEDSFTLAALQLQQKYGNYQPKLSESLVKNSTALYLPERTIREQQEAQIITDVMNIYRQLRDMSHLEAMLSYIDFVKLFPSYGCSYFFAMPTNCKTWPTEIALAINNEGIHIVDNYTKEYIDEFKYNKILTWGHSPNQFVLAVGTLRESKKLTFKSVDGKEISDTLHAYVESRPKTNQFEESNQQQQEQLFQNGGLQTIHNPLKH